MTVWFKTNRILNFYLILTSIMLCIYLILHGLYFLRYISWNINYVNVIILLTPAVYFFFKKIIYDIKYPEKKDIYSFMFPLLVSIGIKIDFFIQLIYGITFIILLLFYTFFYVYRSYIILKKYVWVDGYKNDILNPVVKNWIVFIFGMMLLTLIHFHISQIYYYLGYNNKNFKNFIELSLLIIFLIGYFKVVFTPELLYGTSYLNKVINYKESSKLCVSKVWNLELNVIPINNSDIILFTKVKDEIFTYIQQIDKNAITNYSFRNSQFTINDLSNELGIPTYYLSFIFKYYCRVTFNNYKKIIRIYTAVELINNGYLNTNKLESLAAEVGFASYNPFLVNFKEITGVSPFEFNKKRKIYRSEYLSQE